MIEFIADELSLQLVVNKIIPIEKRKYYTYGFMARAHTKGIKYSDINILRSGWGVED